MKLHETNHRATTQVTNVLRFAARFVILVLLILATLWQPASAQPGARSAEMVVKLKYLSFAVKTGGRDHTQVLP